MARGRVLTFAAALNLLPAVFAMAGLTPEQRQSIARDLATATQQADQAEPARASEILVSAARHAVATAGGRTAAVDPLSRLVREARAGAAVSPASAEAAVKAAYADLTFEPVMEAELPAGFPAPTPVGEVEVKQYPAYRMARATSNGRGENTLFFRLFRHIQANDVKMTTPVQMEPSGDGRSMAFLYERPDQGEAGPAPEGVEVVDVPPVKVVSTGVRGRQTDAAVEEAARRIEVWLDANPEFERAGDRRVMGYNSPFVPARRQFFEVQVPVRAAVEGGRVKAGG